MSIKIQSNIKSLRKIFLQSIESVRPQTLLSAVNNYNLKPKTDCGRQITIQIQNKIIDITHKKCHVVGFGKAVLGMAIELEKALKNCIVDGIITIPIGTLKRFENISGMQLSKESKIEIIEAAENNQPDDKAFEAAKRIKKFATNMTENDILFVLISGGGSALLPLPRSSLTLREKMEFIRELANRGASIEEMNLVRIALSDIKGGRLATAAKNAFAIISFVISDIVNDPVHLIASGPTCATIVKHQTAKDVLQKYNMWNNYVTEKIRQLIDETLMEPETKPGINNSIYVVGDNRIATLSALQEALKCNYNPFIASNSLHGDVKNVLTLYIKLLNNIFDFKNKEIDKKKLENNFPFDKRSFQHFLKTLELCEKNNNPLLLIISGETTVRVTGKGLGGRNQELAMMVSLALYESLNLHNVCFLSAGTDGIDGPTDAAGAIGSSTVISDFLQDTSKSIDDVKTYLNNNDSYNFYKCLKKGYYQIITGHTGTNVMDLHLLLVQ